jgi:hypothetical protein
MLTQRSDPWAGIWVLFAALVILVAALAVYAIRLYRHCH